MNTFVLFKGSKGQKLVGTLTSKNDDGSVLVHNVITTTGSKVLFPFGGKVLPKDSYLLF